MAKLPRDVRPSDLIRVLVQRGFKEIRQSGSHIVLKHDGPPEFTVVIPNHVPLKVGTLQAILNAVAGHLSTDVTELLSQL
jgi:predicted RNA binding protein YcfA (HicA-like mRNA interferase family)